MISKAKDLVDSAVQQLTKYQSGDETPIKTRFDHFNENSLGGIFKGMIITIAGMSGSGKSYLTQQIEEDVFDKSLNPNCDDYILLRCNWEMSVFKLITRKLKRTLNKTMKDIIFTPPTEDENKHYRKVCDEERNENIFYMETPVNAFEWLNDTREFLKQNKDKSHVLITIDHIALIRDDGKGKKKAMDDLVENLNLIKKEFSNVSFVIVSQLNREIEKLTEIKDHYPQKGHLYNSDTMFQISDIVLVIHNPYRLGKDKYMLIPGLKKDSYGDIIDKKYEHLKEYMVKPMNKNTNFYTKGLLFFHYLKIREIDDIETIKDLFVEEMYEGSFKRPEEEELY